MKKVALAKATLPGMRLLEGGGRAAFGLHTCDVVDVVQRGMLEGGGRAAFGLHTCDAVDVVKRGMLEGGGRAASGLHIVQRDGCVG